MFSANLLAACGLVVPCTALQCSVQCNLLRVRLHAYTCTMLSSIAPLTQHMCVALHCAEFGTLLTRSFSLHIAVDQDNLDVPAFVGDGPGHAMPHAKMPLSESLQDTFHRLLPLWHDSIAPAIRSGKRVLIVAHGNSIRVRITHRTLCHVTVICVTASPQC